MIGWLTNIFQFGVETTNLIGYGFVQMCIQVTGAFPTKNDPLVEGYHHGYGEAHPYPQVLAVGIYKPLGWLLEKSTTESRLTSN